MRYNEHITKARVANDYIMPETEFFFPISSSALIEEANQAVTFNHFKKRVAELDASDITNTLGKANFPNFPGDFYKNANGDYVLKEDYANKTHDVYMTIDAYGRVISSSKIIPGDKLTSFDFNLVDRNTLQNNIEDEGVTDAFRIDIDNSTKQVIRYEGPMNHPERVTVNSDISIFDGKTIDFSIGDILLAEKGSNLTEYGILQANGGMVSKTKYKELFGLIGYIDRSNWYRINYGKPWLRLDENFDDGKATHTGHIKYGVTLPIPLMKHISFTFKNKLYVGFGETDNRVSSRKLYSTNINANGDFGAFTEVYEHPRGIVGADVVQYGNFIYVLGGADAGYPGKVTGNGKTVRIEMKDDGTIKEVKELQHAVPKPIFKTAAFIIDRNIYISGGFSTNMEAINDIYVSTIKHDGELTPWTRINSLPYSGMVYVFITDKYVYQSSIGNFSLHEGRNLTYRERSNPLANNFLGRFTWSNTVSKDGLIWYMHNPILGNNYYWFNPSHDYGVGISRTPNNAGINNILVNEIGPMTGPGVLPDNPDHINQQTPFNYHRFYFTNIITSKSNFLIGGGMLPSNNDIRNSHTPSNLILVMKSSFKGKNDWTSMMDTITGKNSANFPLPLIPDMTIGGKIYSHYVKAI